jgi:ribosome biogenesis GTPase A
MHKARKEIKKIMPKIDLIIEVLDARIPYSSENPLISQFRGDKPCIKLLNKSDLADPNVTQQWIEYFQTEQAVTAISVTTEQPAKILQLPSLCKKLLPHRIKSEKPLRTMIMGIPNVGKSSIINILAKRVIAKVGDEPAVTRRQQMIFLDNNLQLSDTPGILWPRFENPNSGYRLATTGAVKDTAMEYDDVALFAAEMLATLYPEKLIARYKLTSLPDQPLQIIEAIGAKRGCLRAGGIVDIHKASEILINEIQAGIIGKISLENPVMIKLEKAELEAKRQVEEALIEKTKQKNNEK